MKISIPNLKKRVAKKYEETVKKAATTAIPVIKKEAEKVIAKGADKKADALFDILTVVAICGGVAFLSKTGSSSMVRKASEAATYVYVENLTINL